MSSRASASGVPLRREVSIASPRKPSKARWFASPVSESVIAACSSRLRSLALAIEMAMSSARRTNLCSARCVIVMLRGASTRIAPQRPSSVVIGAATPLLIPSARAPILAGSALSRSMKRSTLAGRPVRATWARAPSPSVAGIAGSARGPPYEPTDVICPSANRLITAIVAPVSSAALCATSVVSSDSGSPRAIETAIWRRTSCSAAPSSCRAACSIRDRTLLRRRDPRTHAAAHAATIAAISNAITVTILREPVRIAAVSVVTSSASRAIH